MCFKLILLIQCISSAYCAFDFKSQLPHPEWHSIIAKGGMHIGHGRSKRFIQLNENEANTRHQPCTLPNGEKGVCRHLRHCIQDEFRKDAIRFMDYLCVIPQNSIGACCPEEKTSNADPATLAGDLPATAEKNEPSITTRLSRADNRGCGVSTRVTTKLVGARPANPRDWPWMASITPEGFQQYCGGVLITDRHVLTAAHCTRRWKADDLFVRLGEYDMNRSNDSRTYNFKVVEIRQHEQFELASYHNDIAILKLHRPAVFNTYVWPICLPPLSLDLVNQTTYVIGWGTQSFGGPRSDVLLEVPVPVWDHDQCVKNFAENVYDTMLCAGGYEGGKDACQGDSGGPLMYQVGSGRWVAVGVVSWGVRCGEPNHPGLYTRVDQYLPWILDNARF